MKRPKTRVTIAIDMAQAIRRAYAVGNVSQHTLARQLNVSQASVSRAILGKWRTRSDTK
jgi:DNA-binding transcriptional regulator LsrR (DeoR family)